MKILFTGGGSGGHFYPIIAVVEQIEKIVAEEKLIRPKFYYMAPEPTNESLLFEHGIEFIEVPAGKLRIYPSIKNITDIFKTLSGVIKAFLIMFSIFPDVVFGKGGYASFPALFAARILRIPIVIHESDSVPGRTNSLVGRFADRIAVSYAEAAKYFPAKRVAWTGQPIRQSIRKKSREEGEKFFQLESNLPVLLILGGSLGAEKINELVLNSLPKLLLDWQIIHQTGKANIDSAKEVMSVIVREDFLRKRYHAFDFLPDSVLALAV
jgi:UDP-N-acetylglucosamine--N-acetylmuramyl-(pentapeptide) pyrophosphoryl-undecaprenol N-acetylglucosamine transferase